MTVYQLDGVKGLVVPPSVLLADEHRKNRHLAALFIRTSRSRRGTCWSLEVVSSSGLSVSRLTGRCLTRRGRTRRSSEVETSLTVGTFSYGNDQILGSCDNSEVVECLVQCCESLQLAAINLLEPGMEMVTNSHGSQVTIALTGTTWTT